MCHFPFTDVSPLILGSVSVSREMWQRETWQIHQGQSDLSKNAKKDYDIFGDARYFLCDLSTNLSGPL
jgi:hypothetical protein